jgi:hypothetical protein
MTAPTGAAHPTLGSRRKIGVTAIVDPRADSEVDLIETVVRALGDAGLVFLDYRATHSVPPGSPPEEGAVVHLDIEVGSPELDRLRSLTGDGWEILCCR